MCDHLVQHILFKILFLIMKKYQLTVENKIPQIIWM